jgi:hypothetical protein
LQSTYTFHSSLPLGDLIYAMAGIREVCRKYKAKAIIYIGINREWNMAEGIHRKGGITITEKDFEMLRPLLMSQPYIEDVIRHTDESVTVHLDDVMRHQWLNIPYGYIPRWWFYLYPDMACDLSKPWLELDDQMGEMILINRSARYHNPNIDYSFLEEYRHKLLFVGLDDEWKSFCKSFVAIRHYKVQDFLELAIAINSCQLFIGNQSFCFALAEALKVPRILEVFAPLPNVIPTGENARDFYQTDALKYYVEELLG